MRKFHQSCATRRSASRSSAINTSDGSRISEAQAEQPPATTEKQQAIYMKRNRKKIKPYWALLAAVRNQSQGLQAIALKTRRLNQLTAENGYFYHVFQCVKACFAKQSQAVALASQDLDTIFKIFPSKCLADLMLYFNLTYVSRKQSIGSRISAETQKNTVFREKHFSRLFEYGRIYLRIYGR